MHMYVLKIQCTTKSGIPMGINPAVYYANLYLLSFELELLEQLKPLLRVGRRIPAVSLCSKAPDGT